MQLSGERLPAKKPKKIPPLASKPKPGYNFLRIPAGLQADGPAARFLRAQAPAAAIESAPPAAAQSTPQNTVDLATLSRWIVLWLEAREGRRAPMSLRRGPYSPAVIEDLRRATSPATGGARLLRVHAQKTRFGQIRFSASAFYDGRVRAIAGFLDDGEGRHGTRSPQRSRGELRAGLWRVEHIHLI
ncbi:hypothetical protein HMPREF3088_05040 [Corynebacterium sp. HMSC22B11]|nr:hypothetical protein HMPREF3088_05040 [Corynebacterium sp. HMSC22B11]